MMRIATFNANSIRARLGIVLDWLRTQKPDILCIQETKVTDELFPSLDFIEAGYHVVFRGQKSYNGVAIVSRQKPDDVSSGLDEEPRDDTRLLYARFGTLHVVNTYVPQGRDIDHEMYAYKLQWFRRLRAYFDNHFSTRMKVLWTGDLNIAPEPMDIHNPEKQENHVCFHEAVQAAFREAVGWGFVDVFRKHRPNPGEFSYFDYRASSAVKEKKGWRVDHLLASPPLARLSADAYIDLEPRLKPQPSDHTFVVADFDL